MNAINVIHPYKYNGQWVFDDESKELDKEPFVAGADDLIEMLSGGADKCSIVFSAGKFPTATGVIINQTPKTNGEMGTDYLYEADTPHKLWLCPALLKYFEKPPAEIHFQIKL